MVVWGELALPACLASAAGTFPFQDDIPAGYLASENSYFQTYTVPLI